MLLLAAAVCSTGCAGRTLTITQHEYVNTNIHRNRRNVADRVGEPLELNIVCVYPSDLKKSVNAPLDPSQPITSDVWYARRPEVGRVNTPGVFDIPAEQVYLLTSDSAPYGKRVHGCLRGKYKDGEAPVKISGIRFREKGRMKFAGSLFNDKSVIYVFPKFLDPQGQVLAVEPAKFHSPGAYRRHLTVEIGVEDRGNSERQYIRNTTPRKIGKGKSKDN